MSRRAFRAQWVWCQTGVMLEGAWVMLCEGRVEQITLSRPSGALIQDLGQGLLLPGLINAHTHLELSWLAAKNPPQGDFLKWLEGLVAYIPGQDQEQIVKAAADAAQEMAAQGTACAGDITNSGLAQESFAQAGLSGVSFFEALGSQKAEPPPESWAWKGPRLQATAIAAHAPYSVPSWRLKALKKRSHRLPFCIHLAESEAEMEFFAGKGQQGKRLEEFLSRRGMKRQDLELKASRPLPHLMALGVVDQNTLLIHGVHLSRSEAAMLAGAGASLCICPRSNLGLTGAMAPVAKLVDAGVNLALGTDSLASAPDLSLWAEMAVLYNRFPGLDPELILAMATTGGAKALGLGRFFGGIFPGAAGPLAFVPLADLPMAEALGALVSGDHAGMPRKVS